MKTNLQKIKVFRWQLLVTVGLATVGNFWLLLATFCNIVNRPAGMTSWTDQLDGPAGRTSWTDQFDGPAGRISRADQFSLKPWPVHIFEDWPFSLYIVAACKSDESLVYKNPLILWKSGRCFMLKNLNKFRALPMSLNELLGWLWGTNSWSAKDFEEFLVTRQILHSASTFHESWMKCKRIGLDSSKQLSMFRVIQQPATKFQFKIF